MYLTIDVQGADEVGYELLRFAERVADVSPVMEEIATQEREAAAKRFDEHGPGWAPLAESTLAAKASAGYPPDILVATGELRDSLSKLGGAHFEIVTPDSLTMGTSDEIAGFHQDGTSRMPARPLVEQDEVRRVDLVKQIQRYMIEGERAAGVWTLGELIA